MKYKELQAIVFDFRLTLLRFHFGIRIRPLPRSWRFFPYGVIPSCLWVGPLELTFGKLSEGLFETSIFVDFSLVNSGISFRFVPRWWKLGVTIDNKLMGYVNAYSHCGPLHIHSYKWIEYL
jgi:hypothetical protein